MKIEEEEKIFIIVMCRVIFLECICRFGCIVVMNMIWKRIFFLNMEILNFIKFFKNLINFFL